jgi:hypothetical protein
VKKIFELTLFGKQQTATFAKYESGSRQPPSSILGLSHADEAAYENGLELAYTPDPRHTPACF